MSVSKRIVNTSILTPSRKFDNNVSNENNRNVNQSIQKIMDSKVSSLMKREFVKVNEQKILLSKRNQEQNDDLSKQLEQFKLNMSKDEKPKIESQSYQTLNTDRRAQKKAEEVLNANIRRNLFESLWSKSKRRVRSVDASPLKSNLPSKAHELITQNSIKQRSECRFDYSDIKQQKRPQHVEFQTPVMSQVNKKRYEKTPFPKNELLTISQTSSSQSE